MPYKQCHFRQDSSQDHLTRKPHHYFKVGIPSVGCNSYKNVLPQIFKTKHCISETSSCETAHLRKLQVDNTCVNVAYISDTILNLKPILFHKYSKFTELKLHT